MKVIPNIRDLNWGEKFEDREESPENYDDFERFTSDLLKNKYAFPASKRIANLHRNAVKFGIKQRARTRQDICACCMKNIEKESLGTCQETIPSQTDLKDMQQNFPVMSGVAMFFLFIKMTISYLLIRLMINDLFNIITNLNSNSFISDINTDNRWVSLSVLIKQQSPELLQINGILSLTSVIVSIAFFMAFRKIQYDIYEKIDTASQTSDDFALFVEGIPTININQKITNPEDLNRNFQQELQVFFHYQISDWIETIDIHNFEKGSVEESYFELMLKSLSSDVREKILEGTLDYQMPPPPKDIVKEIAFGYDISNLKRIHEKREHCMTQHQQLAKNVQFAQHQEYMNKVELLNKSYLQASKRMSLNEDFVFHITHFVGCAFVSFKFEHFREALLKMYENNKNAFFFKGCHLRVSEASHPSDVKWMNLSLPEGERSNRQLVSFSVLFLTLLVGFLIILLVNLVDILFEYSQKVELIINTSVILITMLVNQVLRMLIHSLVAWESHLTKSAEKDSAIVKLLATQFINTSLIYLVVSDVRSTNIRSWVNQSGIITQISSLILLSGTLQVALNFLNFSEIMRRLKLWAWYDGGSDHVSMYQLKLNAIFEYNQFDVAERYTYYLVQIYTASFYSYLVPIIMPALLIIFACQYWVDKHNLFTRSSFYFQLNYSLSRKILKYFQASILFYSTGALLFSTRVEGLNNFYLIGFFVSLCYVAFIALASKELEKKVFSLYERYEDSSYDECQQQGKFTQTYRSSNPVTQLQPASKTLMDYVKGINVVAHEYPLQTLSDEL